MQRMMIARPALLKSVRDGLKTNPVVALLGPRQCGKTTLARGLAASVATSYFDLENPADLARPEDESMRWREDFVRTFLERDLPQLGMRVAAATMRRFWTMLAHYAGAIWNGSEIGRSLGDAHTTVRRHLDLLASALVVRVLQPWHENLGKRQVKAPKVYVRDTGLLHALLGVPDIDALEGHPKLGASWESFAIEQVLLRAGAREACYWRTQAGAELDLLLFLGGKRIGVEVKYGDAPAMTKSLASALADLRLNRLFVVHAGTARFPLGKKVEALPLQDCVRELARLGGRRRYDEYRARYNTGAKT